MSFRQRLTLAFQILLRGETHSADTMSRSIPAISAEEVAEARRFFPMEKFFIFGHARSGTTMLTRLVRLHPQVHCNYQAHFFTRAPLLQALVMDEQVGEWLRRPSNRWNRGGDLSPVVLRAAADFILERDARREGKQIVGDKSPNSLLDGEAVRRMQAVYPDARLVYIVRDGRDAALSHRFQAFIDKAEHLNAEDIKIRDDFARNAEPYLHGERSLFTAKGIRRAAEGWVRNVTETHGLGKELYGERYYSLRYEDLLAHPWQEMSRLWQFLGADPDIGAQEPALSLPKGLRPILEQEMNRNPDAEWQKEKAQDIAQALQKGKKGSWREMFTPHDREIFQQIAGETLLAWGYQD